jgi:NMD protein affecting ribosome stability and mRNA decay
MEGKSFGKKKRCWYIPAKDLIYCHNCGWSSRPLKWIMQAGLITREDVQRELEEGEFKVYATPYGMYNEHQYYGRAHFPKTPDTRYNEYNCVYDDDWDD